jgi:WD40 repeat protein
VTVFGSVVSQSDPHIYLSALVSAPERSEVSWRATLTRSALLHSRDGQRIVSGSDDFTIRVWDAETGDVEIYSKATVNQSILSGSHGMARALCRDLLTTRPVQRPATSF